MIKQLLLLLSISASAVCMAQETAAPAAKKAVHPEVGHSVTSSDGKVKVTLLDKKQNYGASGNTRDTDINSPKSVNIHPNGKKYYVNSLEGATTVCYAMEGNKKLGVIHHRFKEGTDDALWSQPSGLFPWTHYTQNLNTFYGKPVESTFSHNGRYLWVPYYRRSFDINAQDPSAVAIIDTESDAIIRLMETGPLPKMITTSPDGNWVAISHWGNNTVGLIDITSANPKDWKYTDKFVVDYEMKLNFPMDRSVDRDNGSGYALRGTVFTPDNKYLLIGCMGGGGGIAVIDIQQKKYLGRLMGMMDNVRHLVLSNGYLYLSINRAGVVQRTKLSNIITAIKAMSNEKGRVTGWEDVKVGNGARTICLTPDGRYLFAACNLASSLYVVDTSTMSVIAQMPADSFPVGLDISDDGKYVFMTSQGREHVGGNCVDIFEIAYDHDVSIRRCITCGGELDAKTKVCKACNSDLEARRLNIQQTDSLDAEKADDIKQEAPALQPMMIAGMSIGGLALLAGIGLFMWKNKSA